MSDALEEKKKIKRGKIWKTLGLIVMISVFHG